MPQFTLNIPDKIPEAEFSIFFGAASGSVALVGMAFFPEKNGRSGKLWGAGLLLPVHRRQSPGVFFPLPCLRAFSYLSCPGSGRQIRWLALRSLPSFFYEGCDIRTGKLAGVTVPAADSR